NAEELHELDRLLDEAISEVRTVSHLLHPPTLDLMGLRSALLWYAEGFEQRTQIRTFVAIPDSLPHLGADIETALFRIVQECLTNVHRHANATRVAIEVAVEPSFAAGVEGQRKRMQAGFLRGSWNSRNARTAEGIRWVSVH